MYLDRIYDSKKYSDLQNISLKSVPQLVCPYCKQHIGVPFNYAKEDRLAYRLFVGMITKKVINAKKVGYTP